MGLSSQAKIVKYFHFPSFIGHLSLVKLRFFNDK
jgi:hypothetical protein